MPYKSEKQRRYLKANKPEVAKKYDAKEPSRRGKTGSKPKRRGR